jgi:hypothetical protein
VSLHATIDGTPDDHASGSVLNHVIGQPAAPEQAGYCNRPRPLRSGVGQTAPAPQHRRAQNTARTRQKLAIDGPASEASFVQPAPLARRSPSVWRTSVAPSGRRSHGPGRMPGAAGHAHSDGERTRELSTAADDCVVRSRRLPGIAGHDRIRRGGAACRVRRRRARLCWVTRERASGTVGGGRACPTTRTTSTTPTPGRAQGRTEDSRR